MRFTINKYHGMFGWYTYCHTSRNLLGTIMIDSWKQTIFDKPNLVDGLD